MANATILIAEDEEEVRLLLVAALVEAGYTVVEAKDGSDGLAKFNQHRTRVMLLIANVVMPELSAADLVRFIRKDVPDLPVIFISGYSDHPSMGGAMMNANNTMLLRKPFSIDTLLHAVSGFTQSQLPR